MNQVTWIDIAMLIITVIGGGFALLQWTNSNKIRRAEFIDQINGKLRFDDEFAKIMYRFEYGDKWYDDKFHGSEELERKVDKVLSYLSYICYLKNTKNINEKEFELFIYKPRLFIET